MSCTYRCTEYGVQTTEYSIRRTKKEARGVSMGWPDLGIPEGNAIVKFASSI